MAARADPKMVGDYDSRTSSCEGQKVGTETEKRRGKDSPKNLHPVTHMFPKVHSHVHKIRQGLAKVYLFKLPEFPKAAPLVLTL